jgi:diacylglycerol kinase (ATP)
VSAPFPAGNSAAPDVVLANPTAGSGKASRALGELRRFANQNNWLVEFQISSSVADLARLARNAVNENRSRIFVLGGDGTFQTVANALGPYPPVILGLLPAGGGNDLAVSLGIPLEPLAAAKRLVPASPKPLDAVRVRTSDGTERLFTSGGGVGLDAEAARIASGPYRAIPGRARYILSALRALLRFQPLKIDATLDTASGEIETLSASAFLAAVLNAQSYGAGVRIAPEADLADSQLDFVLLQALSFFEIMKLLPALIFTGTLSTPHLQRRRVVRVRIESSPVSVFHGDGEILGMTPVELEVVPAAFQILRP